ncbi:MAG: porin family protein [Porphyromonadaceae bacterium]|nr:porin family protein [Porphyromonadaceae bacterium]
MKQKISVVAVLFCLFSTFITAQTEKGKFSISGRSSIEGAYFSNRVYGDNISIGDREAMDVDGYSFSITPSLSYFVIDNVSIGGQATFSIADGDYQSKTTEFILMPTVAYYFPTKKMIRPFVALGAGYANVSMESMSFSGFNWAGGIGAAFFLSNNISIDLMAEYAELSARTSENTKYRYSTKGLGGSVGLSVYF